MLGVSGATPVVVGVVVVVVGVPDVVEDVVPSAFVTVVVLVPSAFVTVVDDGVVVAAVDNPFASVVTGAPEAVVAPSAAVVGAAT